MGYWLAGWDVVGVDIEPQPRYPFPFLCADALELDPEVIATRFDAIHASPPCQFGTSLRSRSPVERYDNLIPATRELIAYAGLPYVIENVEGAARHLRHPIKLCGSSFGLRIKRHRLFECSFPIVAPPCDHAWQNRSPQFETFARGSTRMSGVVAVYGRGAHTKNNHRELARLAMDMDWMSNLGLSQSIPCAFTEYIGARLWHHVVTDPRIRRAAAYGQRHGEATGRW